jgi:teichuronic acid biosynthesis glycosyltransferase TuaG
MMSNHAADLDCISIVMPVYNGIEFMHESVQSVLAQTHPRWELVIGVNGHPPNSDVYRMAEVYEEVDKRIRVVDMHMLKGKSVTLNEMVRHHCSHSYVALLDVDDVWHYRKLELQIPFLLSSYDVVGSNCIWFGDIEGVIPRIPVQDISEFHFATVNPIINSSAVVRKELCGWSEEGLDGVEDYDLWLRLRKSNHRFYNCPEVLVKHRIHRNSAFNAKGNHDMVTPLLRAHGFL